MTKKNKFKVYLFIAIVFIILSIIIFIMADGLRRWYSGAFFSIMGLTLFTKSIYEYRNNEKDSKK